MIKKIMIKKILICSMCFTLLLGVSVSAENNTVNNATQGQTQMPQGVNPPSNRRMPEGMELPEGIEQPQGMSEGMELPEGVEPPQSMPDGFNFGGTQTQAEPMTFMGFVKEYQTPVISIVLLLLAFVFVKLYKRKNY